MTENFQHTGGGLGLSLSDDRNFQRRRSLGRTHLRKKEKDLPLTHRSMGRASSTGASRHPQQLDVEHQRGATRNAWERTLAIGHVGRDVHLPTVAHMHACEGHHPTRDEVAEAHGQRCATSATVEHPSVDESARVMHRHYAALRGAVALAASLAHHSVAHPPRQGEHILLCGLLADPLGVEAGILAPRHSCACRGLALLGCLAAVALLATAVFLCFCHFFFYFLCLVVNLLGELTSIPCEQPHPKVSLSAWEFCVLPIFYKTAIIPYSFCSTLPLTPSGLLGRS